MKPEAVKKESLPLGHPIVYSLKKFRCFGIAPQTHDNPTRTTILSAVMRMSRVACRSRQGCVGVDDQHSPDLVVEVL